MKKRAIIIVIDSMGIGALPDCGEFGDTEKCNTLKNVCAFNKGLDVPVLEALGLGNIQEFEGIEKTETFFRQIGMPLTFTELGIGVLSEEELALMADRVTDGGTKTVGHIPLGYEDVMNIYRMANI